MARVKNVNAWQILVSLITEKSPCFLIDLCIDLLDVCSVFKHTNPEPISNPLEAFVLGAGMSISLKNTMLDSCNVVTNRIVSLCRQ